MLLTRLALVAAAVVSVDLNVHRMNLLLRNVHKSPSLIAFSDYREAEAHNDLNTSVSNSGELLEYETLELRVHPPNIDIDNEYDPSCTLITVDSANRPGTLVEVLLQSAQQLSALLCKICLGEHLPVPCQVVQHFTELGLNVRRARISSDGGWFVDGAPVYCALLSSCCCTGTKRQIRMCAVFEVTDSDGSQVTSHRKLASIRQVSSNISSLITPLTQQLCSDLADSHWFLQMLNIHLRGQEVPACNAGISQATLLSWFCSPSRS